MFSLLININKCNLIVKWYQERKKEKALFKQLQLVLEEKQLCFAEWVMDMDIGQ